MTSAQRNNDECRSTWLSLWGHHVWESLPACVFLVALSVLVHPYLESDSFAEWMTRQLASVVYEAKLSRSPASSPGVTVFMLDAVSSRALEETRPLSADLVRRYGGDRPLDRCKAAKMLASLAEEATWAVFVNPTAPKVLAIDFDVAPLLLEPATDPQGTSHGCPLKQQIDDMVKALDALRRRFDVVIVVNMARAAGIEREKRREFLQRARCTGASGPVVGPVNASGSQGKLYVASALFHASPQKIISQYLNERKSDDSNATNATNATNAAFGQGPDGLSHGDLPRYFPSLGRLLGFVSRADFAVSPVTESEKSTLESQCVVATRAGQGHGDAALTEEAVGGDDPQKNVGERLNRLYSRAYIDWSTTTDGRIDGRGITLVSPGSPAGSGATAPIALEPTTVSNVDWSNVILLTVDTGANSDKHATSSGDPAMTGGKVHAAIAKSKLIRLAETRAAALADLFAGLAFVAISSAWGLRVGALPGGKFAAGLAPGGAAQTPWRGLSGLVVALLVLVPAIVTGTALLVLRVSPTVAWDIAHAAPHLSYGLLAVGFGLSASAVIWVDGVSFGQNGLPLEKMAWLSRSVRQMLPLAVGMLIALTAVAASLASLLSTAGGRFFDVKVMLIGLMLHVYMEANHNGVVNADYSWLRALCKACKLLAAGWAAGFWPWLDTLLHGLLWMAVLLLAMSVLVFASH